MPRRQAAFGKGHRQRDRQGRRGCIGEPPHVVDDPIGREVESLADRAEDPRVGLVVDKQIDVLKAAIASIERLGGDPGHRGHRGAERLRAFDPDAYELRAQNHVPVG